jgi:hypothetical protein
MRRIVLLLAFAGAVMTCVCAPAMAASSKARHFTSKKSMWGPVDRDGKPQFPIYNELGAGIWQASVDWSEVATARPANPRDPADPAYFWPSGLDAAVAAARPYGIKVMLQVIRTPRWANGGKSSNWVPTHLSDYNDFLVAAALRYPSVKLWMIWGEPSKRANFRPLTPQKPNTKHLTRAQAAAPRLYARMLDGGYAALKSVRRSNRVIGGNTFTVGDITPYNWVRYMRLPNGRRPRLDLYGHNPFSGRRPSWSGPEHTYLVDFNDLPRFSRFLDRTLRDPAGRRLKLFLSEYFLPTDHKNSEFPFWVTKRLQASWLRDALRITERSSRIYTFGWFSLYDDAPRADGLEVNRGLMTYSGKRKAAYNVFKTG